MDELVEAVKARRRGDDPPRFETPAYREHRADALREAGLADEGDDEESGAEPIDDLADLSVHQHLKRIQKAWQ